ncbi:aldehyde dehydrogenase family protein [Subtercola endophyticus]|uniref:aldehyde dehydrogenase family protein n=1 Tax=Subtercola endophyticus TaxID=2895559 RepID=UPI001E31B07A|nr:aldehyde dehydrogenase family protein [Subtercola endophyticus]UFS58115.1 aldehyde dehydrogenase family protein [Subtercola endophyticus]
MSDTIAKDVFIDDAVGVYIPGVDQVLIGGEWRSSVDDRTWDVMSPSTESVVARVTLPGRGDADAAVDAARTAFDDGPWPWLSIDERRDVVTSFVRNIEERFEDLARVWAIETGAPIGFARGLNKGAASVSWDAALAASHEIVWEEDRGDAIVRHEPLGTVLAVLTYNGPVSLIGMKVVPALLAGCTVIVKHAPETQFVAHIIAEAARLAGFPTGVLSFLPTDTEITQYLVGHAGVDMVTVTGSQAIARDVVERSLPRLARTALELGGKSPAIIGENADLDTVMATLGDGSSMFGGQICVLLSRILVPRSRYEEVTRAFVDFYSALTIGDPLDPATERGPLAVERAVTRTERYVAGAIAQGATVAYGGRRPPGFERGYYYEPTVLTNVTNDMTVAQEEVFGPVTVLIAYDTIDDAIRIANASDYGLAASVYTESREEALAIARRIRSGSVGINLAGMSLGQPFGGMKQSGWGRECGPEGILEFTDTKQMLLPGGAVQGFVA